MNKKLLILTLLFLPLLFSQAEIKFEPIAINNQNMFLFNSKEILAGIQFNKTLFYGNFKNEELSFDAVSFYPEYLNYSLDNKLLYLQNRLGIYIYDTSNDSISSWKIYPNYADHEEYNITRIPKICFSPNYRYAIGKIITSSVRSSIYLFDLINNTRQEIITDVEIRPDEIVGIWSVDSKYFIYQKNDKIYYYSINDYKTNKLLNENWRLIGDVKLNNSTWTDENYLIWIENDLIYKGDPNQFFSRSIYKKYLRQGTILGKIPFKFDKAFDSFRCNENAKKFIIVKNYKSIFYYSMLDDLSQNPYLLLDDKMRFEDCHIFDNGEAILLVKVLSKGKVSKKIIILKKDKNNYCFTDFMPSALEGKDIYNYTISLDKSQFAVNTSNGVYCFDFDSQDIVWKYEAESVIQSVNISSDEWIIGGVYTTIKINPKLKINTPIFASSFNNAGFYNDAIGIVTNNKKYILDINKKTIKDFIGTDFELYQENKSTTHRLVSREINKGFYKEGIYIKDLYSGKLYPITGEPKLKYKLYQPEVKIGDKYYDSPYQEKYEVALVFNCTKSDEGVFPILTTLNQFKISSSFFINGNFMEINPGITKELVNFDLEIGNMFQYYINLTDNDFLIDRNFIRQGLSTNEETFYRLTGKNFTPIWHSPMYAFNDVIIKYGLESGYKYVTYNLDSLDWVGVNNTELLSNYYMNNSQLIERILKNIKPGQIIIFNIGKNDSERSDWLFNEFDLLISELIRAGYSFTNVTDLLKKYRELNK